MSTTKTSNKMDAESRAAEKFARKGNPPQDALNWLHESHHGTLSTLNTREETQGFPTGSVVPFALDKHGKPFVFIANIAAHTKNLKQDNRASLFVYNNSVDGDPQKTWRISLLGRFVKLVTNAEDSLGCELITASEQQELMARYIERVPKAKSYSMTHGFHFWRMNELKSIRYIAGFGRICWIPGEEYLELASTKSFEKMRLGAMEHMNEDHQENMNEICRAFHGVEVSDIQMTSLDLNGFLMSSQETSETYFCSFSKIVEKAGEFKSEIIKVLAQARKRNTEQV